MRNLYILVLFGLIPIFGMSQVGINTASPEQELHLAGTTEKIRIEGLNQSNNNNNLGGDSSSRVYVDANGDLVLAPATTAVQLLVDAENYLNDVENPTNLINQTGNAFGYDVAGIPTDIAAATFTLTKNAIVEVNYAVSWSVYKTSSASGRIDDEHARIVQTALYFRENTINGPAVTYDVDGNAINGGPWCIDVNASGTVCQEIGGLIALNGQFYNNSDSKNGSYKDFVNTGSDYVKLPPGTYIAMFAGQLAVGDVSGTGAVKMYLGSGKDNLQIRVYYYD